MTAVIKDATFALSTTTSSNVNAEIVTRATPTAAGNWLIEALINLDASSEPKIETVTISQANLAASDAYYQVTIAGATLTRIYTDEFDVDGDDDETDVAARLTTLINTHPDVQAVQGTGAAANTIIITSLVPGTGGNFTATVACVAKSNDGAIANAITTATTTAASGTGKVRKIMETTVDANIRAADKKPQFSFTGTTYYNGAASPVSAGALSTFFATHPTTMTELVANNA